MTHLENCATYFNAIIKISVIFNKTYVFPVNKYLLYIARQELSENFSFFRLLSQIPGRI